MTRTTAWQGRDNLIRSKLRNIVSRTPWDKKTGGGRLVYTSLHVSSEGKYVLGSAWGPIVCSQVSVSGAFASSLHRVIRRKWLYRVVLITIHASIYRNCEGILTISPISTGHHDNAPLLALAVCAYATGRWANWFFQRSILVSNLLSLYTVHCSCRSPSSSGSCILVGSCALRCWFAMTESEQYRSCDPSKH